MKILVTTDGSDASWDVAPHAAAFARATGGELLLMRVLDPLVDVGSVLAVDLEEAVARVSAEWEAQLRAEVARRGIEAQVIVHQLRRGMDVHDAIAGRAEAEGAGMVAIQAKGTSPIRQVLVGSVAMGVVGKTTMPVMVTGPHLGAPASDDVYRIAMTSDGSAASAAIVPHVARLCEASPQIQVVLLRVVEDGHGEAEAELERLRAQLPAGTSVDLRAAPKTRDVPARIIELAAQAEADAIAMASQGHGALRHLIAGSVTLAVLDRSPLPVILARAV